MPCCASTPLNIQRANRCQPVGKVRHYTRLNTTYTVIGLLLLGAGLSLYAPTIVEAGNHAPAGPRPVAGWPVILGNGLHCTAAVADVDGDGRDEIAQPLRDGRVILLAGDGRPLPGWPQKTANSIYHSALLADINGNGAFEVVAACSDGLVYVWRIDGSRLPGWPVDLSAVPICAPQLVQFPGDGEQNILIAGSDGRVHLFSPTGQPRTGWPRQGNRSERFTVTGFPVCSSDLDRNGSPEIIYLSNTPTVLQVWTSDGKQFPGFGQQLTGSAVGLAINDQIDKVEIACTTDSGLSVFDAHGNQKWNYRLPDDDHFSSAPAYLPTSLPPNHDPALLAAGTQNGRVYLWQQDGRQLPKWPVGLGGFIYGLAGGEESFAINGAPRTWDVDGDGELEILIGSYDQHLYCLELEGLPVPGWPLILDDAIGASPTFAQLDGTGPLELLVGQIGETLFAYHLGAPQTAGQSTAPARKSDLCPASEWSSRYSVITVIIILLMLMLGIYLHQSRSTSDQDVQPRSNRRVLLLILAVVLVLRGLFWGSEMLRYREARQQLQLIDPIVERVLSDELQEVRDRASVLAAAVDSCRALDADDPLLMRYRLEQIADHHRLDFRSTGLILTNASGEIRQSIGLARGWTHLSDLGLTITDPVEPVLLGDTPVHIGLVPIGADPDSGFLLLCSSLLHSLAPALASATGVSAHVRLDQQTLAWAGAAPRPATLPWPWLGIVEPARNIILTTTAAGRMVSLRLAMEDFETAATGWFDLGLLLLLSVLFYFRSPGALQYHRRSRSRLWFGPFLLLYLLGWFLLSQQQLIQRPIPLAGHSLEFLLHLLGLMGLVILLQTLIGTRRSRRLSFAVIGSYLVVGLAPLVLVLIITNGLVQQAQQRLVARTITGLESRAENMLMAYAGNTSFISSLRQTGPELLDQPAEQGWFNFVRNSQYLFTYDLPSAYLTLWGYYRANPDNYFVGFSYRAPRAEKFSARRPVWGGDRNLKGLFLDGGNTVIRCVHTVRLQDLEAQLVSHIPMDRTILDDLQERLRILPFLPCVRLQPAWHESTPETDTRPGIELPLSTSLVLPARDWSTGASRWVVYRARAFLPLGRELWTIVPTLILLTLLPLGLSIWGAFSTFRRTVRPLTRLLTGIRRVETGNLEYRLANTGKSEIAVAGRAFDRMAASLQENVQQLAEKKKIEEVSELKSHFISMVSHDLKTPLAAIKGASENVLGELAGPLNDRQRRYLEIVLSSSKNLQQMIADLLDLSRIESGHLALERETLDLRREADNVLRSLQPLLDKQKITTSITVETDNTLVTADRTRLWQIFTNIIANSVRYSPVAGSIEIRIADCPPDSAQSQQLQTTITDEGPGIPEEDHARLFEMFYARPAGRKGRHGTGLGLAIVKQLVEKHGGQVVLTNSADRGAQFSFTLPRKTSGEVHQAGS